MSPLVLASTSVYRKELLARLGLDFTAEAPHFNEEAYKAEGLPPLQLAAKLAYGKAMSLAKNNNCVIGGDQIVALGSKIFGKAKNQENAVRQLTEMSGKTHELITAICVIYHGEVIPFVDVTKMSMRKLSTAQIENYLKTDQPYDCAGSYKIEKHGIRLFEKIETQDFTAIQGLPLIQLTTILQAKGYPL